MINKAFLPFLFLCMIFCSQHAQNISQEPVMVKSPPPIPILIAPDSVKSLRDLIDPDFQTSLQKCIAENTRWSKLVSQKKMAVGVVDLSDPFNVRYARLNGNVMMYAASLPKIAILLATMDAIEKGEIEDTPELRAKMQLMISKSSNTASTELIDLLGFEKIESVLEDPKYDLYDEEYGGGLWVGKRYAKTGPRHPDPIGGLSHGATVTQVCRFYYLMAYGKLINYKRSREMLDLMDNPEINHKFVNSLHTLAPNAQLYRKSGTWKTYHSDSVLVWGPERQYILVALINDENGEIILRELVLKIDKLLMSK